MVKIIAIICHLATQACEEKVVTTSEMSGVGMQACMIGIPQLAEWMKQYPAYRLAKWKCQIGDRGSHA